MAKIKKLFRCSKCKEYTSPKTFGKCPMCGEWVTPIEEDEFQETKKLISKISKGEDNSQRLNTIKTTGRPRIKTNISEFDRVFGGGIVVDSVNILGAPPGTGKSTLLLQVSEALGKQGYKVVYISGEESKEQIKERGDRILEGISDNIYILSDTNIDNGIETIRKVDADFVIIDSIQVMQLSSLDSSPGSITQIKEIGKILNDIAKRDSKPRSIIVISQLTKADELKGPRDFEHLVDGVFYLEAEEYNELRRLYSTKNRFGSTGEVGIFEMDEIGLVPIDNPSKYFITEREEDLIMGSALTVIKEGTRPIIIEVESAVTSSYTTYPSRTSECLRKDQLATLVAILEQSNIKLFDKNIIVKTTGGVKLSETSANLSVIMAIASSKYKETLPTNTIFLGEVGLAGDIKKVNNLDIRIKEADRMGFEEIVIPNQPTRLEEDKLNIKIRRFKKLNEIIDTYIKK